MHSCSLMALILLHYVLFRSRKKIPFEFHLACVLKSLLKYFCSSPTSIYVASTNDTANFLLNFTEHSLCDLGSFA